MTSDQPTAQLPTVLEFRGAVPNPFAGQTSLVFSLPRGTNVDLRIYDVAGHLVRTLANGVLPAGEYRLSWNGRADDGHQLGAGVYFAKFTTPGMVQNRKFFLMR